MYYLIYETTNTITGKKYRGKHKTTDIHDGYLGSGKYLKRAISKYGKEDFVKDIIFMAFTEDDLNWVERHIFVDAEWLSSNTYNLKLGGEGGGDPGLVATKEHGLVPTSVYNSQRHMYEGVAKGKLPVIDSNGLTFSVNVDDPRLKTGELVPCLHKNGHINVLDSHGNVKKLHKDEYDKSTHLHLSKGKTSVRDSTGSTFSVNVDDPRLKTGELVGVTKGTSFTNFVYDIFDIEGKIRYTCSDEPFLVFLERLNLPRSFEKSYINGGSPIYQKIGSNRSRIEKSGWLKYVGWYCKRR